MIIPTLNYFELSQKIADERSPRSSARFWLQYMFPKDFLSLCVF